MLASTSKWGRPMVADRARPPDQDARDRITADLDATLFVSAGAGSGKTSALVGRVLALVRSGRCELREVAAITFTEKAGDELRDRIRRELEGCVEAEPDVEAGPDAEGNAAVRCGAALEQLDGAAIGTLHSFCQRLLTEHPVEAGLPPRVEVLDEVSSDVAFEQRWSVFQDEILADPALERTLLLLFASGVRADALRSLAAAFDDNWDLVAEQVPNSAPEPPAVHDLLVPAVEAARSLAAVPCRDPADALAGHVAEMAARLEELAATPDEVDLVEAMAPRAVPGLPSFRAGNKGKGPNWDDKAAVQAGVVEVGRLVEEARAGVANACARRVGVVIRRFTLDSAGERRRAGQLQFHDLLVLARALLRDPGHGPAVRDRLHQHYRRLLLDEFQDTDPIQIEVAVRIAAADPEGAAAGEAGWDEVEVEAGHLFVVGDPKQSIYRFRRADISTFLAAAARFGAGTGGEVELSANFRTGAPVIEWVNDTFTELMAPGDDPQPVASQPAYRALDAVRPAPATGPPVSVLGRDEHPKDYKADDIRTEEAAEVAATVARIVREGWSVDDGHGGWRPALLGDITVLVPARTSLPFLEDAFEAAGLAFRAESSSLVYASRAVRDLLMVLRAVDDPTNYLHVVSALRTPLFGCGDDDLFRFHWERHGRWSYLADQPDSVPDDDPVRAGLEYLRALYDRRHWLSPSELLDRIVRDRRALELGFSEGRPRDVWRRLRFVGDQARSWSDATRGNLRQYLAWVRRQTAEGARVAEAVLPETDDDAARVMTIHSAKGLEFPVTIVSGMSTAPHGRRAPAEVVFPPTGSVGYKFGAAVTTDEYADWAPIDEQMGFHERIRLLYVACTRARDHLVVSLHRKERAAPPAPSATTNAELLLLGIGERLDQIPDGAAPGTVAEAAVAEPPAPPPPFARWKAEHDAALQRASRPRAVAATALTDEGGLEPGDEPREEPDPGLLKRPRDLDLPPWLKGRYGSAVGRAVHGVLQSVDLASGDGLAGAVAAQCEAEAVGDRAGDVASLVDTALGSPSVRAAAAAPHWREVYVCTPVEGRLLEGYVDLLYRGPEGLVVVDYKTSASADPDELDRRVEGYRNQGASYALAVAAATGEPVAAVTFLFLTPHGAVERHLDDLDASIAHVRSLVSAGTEAVLV
jgi:ATP-dependent exoDNAse (exonuclease V) beta subunit